MGHPLFPEREINASTVKASDKFAGNLLHAKRCESQFGRDLLDGVDRRSPTLYSDFPIEGLMHQMKHDRGFSYEFFAEPEFLFFPKQSQSK